MRNEFIRQVKAIIAANTDNTDFSIDQLCQEIGLSRSQLYRKLKSETGLSTSLYIRQVKLEQASILLSNAQLNISEICYQSGFTSPQNFTKYFKEAYGLTPSKYRQQLLIKGKQIEKMAVVVNPAITTPPIIVPPIEKPFSKPIPPKKFTTFQLFTIFLLFLTLSYFVFLYFQSQTTSNPNKDNLPFIAIIPFEQIGFPEDNYLGEGITEDVLIQLTRFDGLNIISKATTFKFQPTDEGLYQKMAAFGTTHILQGEIKKVNHQLMLLVHLVQLSDNREVWSERFTEAEENLFNLAPKVALALSKKFNLSPTLSNSSVAKRNYQPSVPAYNAYLRGQHLMRPRNRDGLEKSIEEFDIALSIDDNYTAAVLAKATAYLLLNRKENTDKAEIMALEVIRKDKQNGDAYALLGYIHSIKNEYIKALTFYEIALELLPDDPMINYWYSLVFRKIGHLKAAMKYGKIAAESAPLHPVINSGYIYTVILAKEYLLAEKLIKQSNQIFENSFLYIYIRPFSHTSTAVY